MDRTDALAEILLALALTVVEQESALGAPFLARLRDLAPSSEEAMRFLRSFDEQTASAGMEF